MLKKEKEHNYLSLHYSAPQLLENSTYQGKQSNDSLIENK